MSAALRFMDADSVSITCARADVARASQSVCSTSCFGTDGIVAQTIPVRNHLCVEDFYGRLCQFRGEHFSFSEMPFVNLAVRWSGALRIEFGLWRYVAWNEPSHSAKTPFVRYQTAVKAFEDYHWDGRVPPGGYAPTVFERIRLAPGGPAIIPTFTPHGLCPPS
jgi:hypothetical protein